jgi:hypothetical protein
MFPLIIASVTAYAASVLLHDRSILTEKGRSASTASDQRLHH